uniref:Uncharacterized protein n=1 Tax=Trichogramma kaykai TaxID=54128 RepID=A0ABD2X8B0_9HYME
MLIITLDRAEREMRNIARIFRIQMSFNLKSFHFRGEAPAIIYYCNCDYSTKLPFAYTLVVKVRFWLCFVHPVQIDK